MKLSKDARLTIGLMVLLLFLGLGAAFLSQSDPVLPPLDSQSSQEDGAKALRLWLDELGYDVSVRRLEAFEMGEETDVVLMLEPSVSVTASEARVLKEWVENGGKLLVVDSGGGAGAVLGLFRLGLGGTLEVERELVRQHPALRGPLAWESVTMMLQRIVTSAGQEDLVVYLAHEESLLVVGVSVGEGEVVVTSLSEMMTNLGLQSPDQAALAAAIVSLVADQGETIWFDDWHHGRRIETGDRTAVGTGAWLRQTPVGRSFLLAAGIGALAIVLSGRGFGRPIPIPEDKVRRAPLEYVTAIGNLNRRAGNRQAILAEYKMRFKRDLGRRYRIDASLDDADYLYQLERANPSIDSGSVRDLLVRLSDQNISEGDLVALAKDLGERGKN